MVGFNGSKGRIEMEVFENSYVNAGGDKANEGALKSKKIMVYPMFAAPYEAEVTEGKGGHGGGDPVLLNDIFGVPERTNSTELPPGDGASPSSPVLQANKSSLPGVAG